MTETQSSEKRLHFIGIGGIGMSGIAEVLLNQGYQISGSDLSSSDLTSRLAALGALIFTGHKPENVQGAHVVVISSAVKESNPELLEARRLGIPVIHRAQMLAEIMRGKTGIAIAGTHGKTTTTSMLATVLTEAGLDPTLVIGGRVDSLGGNAKLGNGKFVVAEADESDGSFLRLPATYAIITNIDNDHLDHYRSMAALENAFIEFVARLPLNGFAAVCGDDPGVRRCLQRFSKPISSYGLSDENEFFAASISIQGFSLTFDFYTRPRGETLCQNLGQIRLNVPGQHNILNALGALTIGFQLGLPFEKLRAGLARFKGVKRRFEIRWQNTETKQIIIDDYGHHPTEVVATLKAARSYWPGRIITVFQPHRYTRTQECYQEFLTAFQESDIVLLTDIYPAGEEPIPGVTSEILAHDLAKKSKAPQQVRYVGDLVKAQAEVLRDFREGDLLLCLGAGSITRLPEGLIAKFRTSASLI